METCLLIQNSVDRLTLDKLRERDAEYFRKAGAKTENGHKVRGTILHKDICAECWRRNIIMPMVVKLKATE